MFGGADDDTFVFENTTAFNNVDTALSIDRDDRGGTYSFAQIAMLIGVTGLTDEVALETAGTLITA